MRKTKLKTEVVTGRTSHTFALGANKQCQISLTGAVGGNEAVQVKPVGASNFVEFDSAITTDDLVVIPGQVSFAVSEVRLSPTVVGVTVTFTSWEDSL